VAAQLTERIAGLPPAHDASWARQVGAPALALLQVPAHGPGDPGPTTTPGLVDTDPVAVRGLATVWRTASIEIAAGRVRANQRAVSLPLPVRDDPGGSVEWEPPWPASLTTEPRSITATEAELDRLGLLALRDFRDMADDSFETADARFDTVDRKDDHNDAFRHTYWNALMARRFGEDWAEAYTDAHEGVRDNTAAREVMDLYNNSVGRRLATENPDADAAELADLVEQAVACR